jgi:hypothetical protein
VSHCQKETLEELSITLDQLLQSTKALQAPNIELLSATEIDLVKKTQESLSAHFVHTKGDLESRNKERATLLIEKLAELKELDSALYNIVAKTLPKAPVVGFRPRIGRNRRRSKTSEFAHCAF